MDDQAYQWESMVRRPETFDLTGSVLNVTAVMREIPYASYRMDVELFQAIQFVLNFSIIMQKEESWGGYNESTGESTGMVRQILEQDADLAFTASAIIPVLHEILDFTMTTYTFGYAAIFRKPTFLRDSYALLRPFHWSLWLAVGLWCACVYNAIRTAAYLSRLLMKTRIDRDTHSLILPFSLLCGKSPPCKMLATAWCRLIVYTGAMSALVLHAAFSAVLLSFLFISHENSSLSQLQSLGKLEFVIDPGNVFLFEQKIKGAQPSEFLTLYTKSNKVLDSTEAPASKAKILEGRWVALTGEWGAYDSLSGGFDPTERCAVVTAMLPIGKQQWGCMIKKRSKYKRSIDYAILKSKATGLVDLWQKRFAPQGPACPSGGKYDAVPFECIYLAVSVFCSGFVCCVAILIVEMLTRQHANRASEQ